MAPKLTRLTKPALYQDSVRNLAALTRMRLATILYPPTGTFAGFFPTAGHPTAVALV
jgi:hypothetical protein